jgi:hypothetical protein
MLVNKQLSIALRRPVNLDRDQKVAAIDQTTGRERLVDRDQMFGQPWLSEHEKELLTNRAQCYLTLRNVKRLKVAGRGL